MGKWDQHVSEIEALREQGAKWREIGAQLGVDGNTAQKGYHDAKRRLEKRHTPTPPAFPDWMEPEDVDWREWFDQWENVLALHKRIDPTQEILTVDLTRCKEPVAVAFASDLHMGGGFTNHAAIKRTVEFILDTPNLYVGITGDSIEGFIPGMKPAETVEQQPSGVKAQLAALRSLVSELSDRNKLLWMTWGDHDAKWFEQAIGLNVVKSEIHDRVPYFTGRGLVILKLNDQTYYICVNHAERFSSQWNTTHAARRQYERFFPADVNATAHRHKPAFMMDHHYDELREAGLELGGEHWMIQSGTFKTGPDPYTIRSWNKGVIGVPTVVFSPHEHDTNTLKSPALAAALVRGLA